MKRNAKPAMIVAAEIREPEADRIRNAIRNRRPRSDDLTIQKIAGLISKARRDPEMRMVHVVNGLDLLAGVPDANERVDLAMKLKDEAKRGLSNPESAHYMLAVQAVKICDEVIYPRINVDETIRYAQS
ncbi:MAG: hypothetical protein WC263_04005 [Candidatus Micrarchaeia archaeon]|jgi:hypothetical protein